MSSTSATARYVTPDSDAPEDVFRPRLFEGKVLFCTGGGSGICKEITRSVMKLGADAVIVGRNAERLESTAKELSDSTGRTCLAAPADVRQPTQLKEAVARCVSSFGRIDFVVCGAAGNFLCPIAGLSENAFRTVMDIDANGTFNTVKATLPAVREAHGAYVHMGATIQERGTPFQAHASAAKAAIDALSAALAAEEGPAHGVRSNVLAPGPVAHTPGMARLTARSEGAEDALSAAVPLQRQGAHADLAGAAVWLFSGAARWVTGQVLVVDGGARHTLSGFVPYPQAVLDPDAAKAYVAPR